MKRLGGGDTAGFHPLYQKYSERVYRFCLRLSACENDAEDMTQEVFLALCQSASRFERRSSLATWLYRIALHRWYNLRRSRRSQPETQAVMEQQAPRESDPGHRIPQRIDLERALAMLTDDQREAFLLVKVEGLKYREAAETLGVPQGTVQSRVHDARLVLQALLAEPANEGQGVNSHAL
jgi:RNA polymerase sigma-70 factor, ECF subfamily